MDGKERVRLVPRHDLETDRVAGDAHRPRLLARTELLHERRRRRRADDAGERLLGDGDARQLGGARDAAVDLPLDEIRVGEEVGQVAEARDDRSRPEVGRLVLEELDFEDVAGLRAADGERACQRVAEPEVQPAGVGVRALAGQLAGEAVLRFEPDLLVDVDLRERLQIRMPAVMH